MRLQKRDGKNGKKPTGSRAGAGGRVGGGRSRVWDTHHPGNEMSLALGAGGTIPGPAEAGQEACGGLWFQENANQFQMVMEHPAPRQPSACCTLRSSLVHGAGSLPAGQPRKPQAETPSLATTAAEHTHRPPFHLPLLQGLPTWPLRSVLGLPVQWVGQDGHSGGTGRATEAPCSE